MRSHTWTESDRQFIRNHWPKWSIGKIAMAMGLIPAQVSEQIYSVMNLPRKKQLKN